MIQTRRDSITRYGYGLGGLDVVRFKFFRQGGGLRLKTSKEFFKKAGASDWRIYVGAYSYDARLHDGMMRLPSLSSSPINGDEFWAIAKRCGGLLHLFGCRKPQRALDEYILDSIKLRFGGFPLQKRPSYGDGMWYCPRCQPSTPALGEQVPQTRPMNGQATCGVLSWIGRGVITASTSKLFQLRGNRVDAMKVNPYLNIDTKTLNAIENGEAFVCEEIWRF